jgi:tetratricopeptide (TPR) repeat protein
MEAVLRELEEAAAGRAPAPAGDQAVAIMSFANLSRNGEDDWLGTGIAETLAVGLSGVAGLSVVPRERIVEVLRKLGVPTDSDDPALAVRLGQEIGAPYVVSGGYQILGGQVRVTARVTDVRQRRVASTLKVDGSRAETFALQDRLVAEISAGFSGPLPASPLRDETTSLAAFEAHSKGLLNLRGDSRESLDRAVLLFEQAIAHDPRYARAHMHLGAALDIKGDFLGLPDLSRHALASLERALELEPGCGETWRYKGGAFITLDRDEEALSAYERALEANPTDASAHSGIGRVHFILRGDFITAMAGYERALALNPQAGWSALQYAHCAALSREFTKAEGWARRAIVLQRELLSGRTGGLIIGAHVRLGQTYALQGRHAEALAEYDQELESLRDVDHALRGRIFIELHQRRGESRLALGDAEAGRLDLELALEAFERRLRNGADDPMTRYYAACAHALRGETEAALACLEKACERRLRLTVARGRIEASLAGLQVEPRFQDLVARAAAAAQLTSNTPSTSTATS